MGEFLKICGDYRNWSVYRKSVIICDVTEMFIGRYLPIGSRTIDQMRQAARSCKQNIVEGVSDGTISAEICIKLLGIARGSARELLEDYADYLRQHKCEIWEKDDYRINRLREFAKTHYAPEEYVSRCEMCSAATTANVMLTLLYQIDAMLAKVLKKAEQDFIENGGIREAMARSRRDKRGY